MVGDAVAKPLLDAWDAMPEDERPDISALFSISNGGAPMSTGCKARILDRFPNVMVNDGFGSSEAGIQGSSRVTAADVPASGAVRFSTAGAKPILVLDDDDRPVVPGDGTVGRIVTGGRLPLEYHKDPEKTAATFLTVDGERWLITGDLATVAEDGSVELLGRGSTSINTGGEKVHPEEVEGVLHGHPAVADVLVVGVPDERWGSAVTAVVQPAAGAAPTLEELVAHCKQQLSGYKAPKHLVLVDAVVRSPAGKADYRWALDTAVGAGQRVLTTACHGKWISSGHRRRHASTSQRSVSSAGAWYVFRTRPRFGCSDGDVPLLGHGAAALGEEPRDLLPDHVLDPDLSRGPRRQRDGGAAVAQQVGQRAARRDLIGVHPR